MAFTKIKYSKGDVSLAWKDDLPRTVITHELNCGDPPRPEFVVALAAFATYLLDIAELDSGWNRNLTIQSVAISENDQGRGIVVTGLKKVAQAASPIVINTPFLSELASYEGGPQLPRYAIGMLDALEVEAGKYRQGERAQTDLFPKKVA
ncbi:MAG: hypothetical protein WC700_02005 [Gemmatimonadaceae bacterium]|jgi:hypothetical protein